MPFRCGNIASFCRWAEWFLGRESGKDINAYENTHDPAVGRPLELQAGGPRPRVLVVDDEPLQLTSARLVLHRNGYEATVAASGEEAVAHFVAAHQENRDCPFDVILLDMVMPGLDGLATYERIRELFPAVRVIVSSGYAPAERGRRMKELGAAWLEKPYEMKDLVNAIRQTLEQG